MAGTVTAEAAPFAKWFEHRRADGSVLRIWGEGDEYGAHFEDERGRTLVYNPAVGDYEYAAEEDEPTRRAEAQERLERKAEETGLAKRWAKLKENKGYAGLSSPIHKSAQIATNLSGTEEDLCGLVQICGLKTSANILSAPPSSPTEGRIVGVTVLVDFPMLDADGNETNTLAQAAHPDVTADDLRELINGEGFAKWGNASSVREYYAEATSGHVDYTNVVVGWVKAPYPREHYDVATKDNGTCGRALIGDVFDAIASDPSRYLGELMQATANGDGEFLALNVLFAGPEATTWSYGLWAHQWVLAAAQYNKLKITVGSKAYHFFNYQISPVTASPTIHTFCHESGHMICDFPDLYAYSSGLGNGVGNWCLMCGRTDDRHPQNFCAYLRAAAGWVVPKELPAASGAVTVTADLQDVWKFPHPSDPKQYYLIENRQATGRDRELRGSGIVIYRCDESGDNTTGAKTAKSVFKNYGAAVNRLSYEVSVEQADGLYEIEQDVKGKYNGDANDTWHADNSAELYTGTFNATTTPCARWTDGTAAKLNLSQFSTSGATMTFWHDAGDAEGDEGDGDSGDYSATDAIYVNGVSTAAHTSGGGAAGDAAYWRVTDGRIVLRGNGPYVISGRGTTPIRCAPKDDGIVKVTLNNLAVSSKDSDYGAFDCGLSASKVTVHMTLKGTNTLASTYYSTSKSFPGLCVEGNTVLAITNTSDTAVLRATGGAYASGIGGGYSKGILTTSRNDCGSVHIYGGTIVAQGGSGAAGIGGGYKGDGYLVRVRGGKVTATGGAGAAGIGGGTDANGGYYYQYNGTVLATAGGALGSKTGVDIGRGGGGSKANRLYISGGSLALGTGDNSFSATPSNATHRVRCCTVTGLEPGAAVAFEGLGGYGQKSLYADATGRVRLWLPAGDYDFASGDTDYAATVTESSSTTATGSSEFGRWLKQYSFLDHDLPTWAERERFKSETAGTGKAMSVFDEYVALLDPTNPGSTFRATIRMEDGQPIVECDPYDPARRTYTLLGAETLNGDWHEADAADHFFKVEVSLP